MSENILDAFKEDHSAKKEIDMSKKLKVGIIGTGWIAGNHITSYLTLLKKIRPVKRSETFPKK